MTKTICSNDGRFESADPKLILFHNSRDQPITVVCIKDNPEMKGFGRKLKVGDEIKINGTTSENGKFQVSAPDECAFYDYKCFEPKEGGT